MTKPGHKGFKRVVKATEYSIMGLTWAWRHESSFRQECGIAVLLVPAAFLLGGSATQTALLIGVCLVVLITELLNSAVEAAVDSMGQEPNDLAGHAKDMGSAAVTLSLLLAWIVWIGVAIERLHRLL